MAAGKIAVSAALIAFVCRHIDATGLARQFAGQTPGWVAATALIGLVQIALLTLRWQQILRGLGGRIGIGPTLSVTYMGCFFGACLLGPAGSDVARAVLAPSRGLGRRAIVHSIVFERLASVAGLGLAAAPLLALAAGPPAQAWALAASLAIVPLPFVAVAGIAWLARATAGRSGALCRAVQEFDRSRQELCRAWPRFAAAAAIAAAGQGLVAGEAWCLSQAQHLGVAFRDFAVLMPPVTLLVSLPISAGGWGVREGAMVAALAMLGVDRAAALLLSVELGALTLLVSLPGGAIWLWRCLRAPNRAPRGMA